MLKLMKLPVEIYTENGLITTLSSKRDLLLFNAMEYVEAKWKAINYIIGGTDFRTLKVEIELIDIFLFFGVVGIIIYVLFVKTYLYSKKMPILNSLLVLTILIGILSGNLVPSITNATFFALTFLYLKNNFGVKI